MLTGFRCPDGQTIPCAACLTACRMQERCVPELILRAVIGRDRAPSELPSVTQLVKPLRVAYLESTQPYAVSPIDSLWALRGAAMHALIDPGSIAGHVIERRYANEYMTGQPDDYEISTGTLYDWKSVARHKQGLMMKDLESGAPDYVRQLNGYRVLLHDAGLTVNRMVLVAVTRDFRNYEFDKEVQAIQHAAEGRAGRVAPALPVPPLVQYTVPVQHDAEDWFHARSDRLRQYIATHTMPPLCTEDERWRNDGRCRRWCNGAASCDYGRSLR